METSIRETAGVEDVGYGTAIAHRLPPSASTLVAAAWTVAALLALAGVTWLLATTPLGIVAVYAFVLLLPLLIPAFAVWLVTGVLEG